jgi:hypothetical protein
MARALIVLITSLIAVSAPVPASALGPAQPFTPPAPTSRAADPVVAAAAQAAPGSGLAGVRLGSSPRALIDGEWVALGATVREGRLVAVHPHEVVVRLANGRTERLALFPPLPVLPDPAGAPGTETSIVKRNLP